AAPLWASATCCTTSPEHSWTPADSEPKYTHFYDEPHYYRLEPSWESGWIHRSTLIDPVPDAELEPLNVALLPSEAHSKLKVSDVVLGTYHGRRSNGHLVELIAYATGMDNEDKFLRFNLFDHEKFRSTQEYFDFLGHGQFQPARGWRP
ncbi:hypothetical protein, partial [Micrococcoides hystricis]